MRKRSARKKIHDSKQRPQQKQFKDHTDRHHIYPTSRFILKRKIILHVAWHNIFQDLTPEEAMERVVEWQFNAKQFKEKISDNEYRLKDWKLLFGDAEFDKVLQIIQKEWTYPGVRMIKI